MSESDPFRWQAGVVRADRPMLGGIAEIYDELRPGYGDDLAERVVSYTGTLTHIIEVGAGTGKGTDAFVKFEVPLTCIEPDAAMARVLRRRFEHVDHVDIRETSFEEWDPPAEGVSLIYSAQAWHWVDANVRCERTYGGLEPGGAVALFGHRYFYADPAVERAVDDVYLAHAPHLLGDRRTRTVAPHEYWYATELTSSGLFSDIEAEFFDNVVSYTVQTCLNLIATFSSHRQIPREQLVRLLDALADVLCARGNCVDIQLATVLTLGRRASA